MATWATLLDQATWRSTRRWSLACRDEKASRGSETKAVVVIAVELLSPTRFGRCRLRVSPSAAEADLTSVVRDLVEPGSVLLADTWLGYGRVEQHGYARVATNPTKRTSST